ncbi:penicillin-insensitive murein endopeptidase [Falsirhodobacter algicola]|uniref:Penicillin-insensitive murein endopeptidase n=1 Tax=Falsirhodobacter algicola TaxID=2692330 RepID=A0A8J8MSV6_9RHOB|nr:penicillin-insensitive murein endopeptidase [Falsirhodobacter algicola]QUS36106.1 penicillin-insensitive murein endopeptidase [Falsirhodobacter algicola]
MIPLLAAALSVALSLPAAAQTLASEAFAAAARPTSGPAHAIGGYSRGCATGLQPLAETGPTWQVMRTSRNRNWGQPETIRFLQDLSVAATKVGWRGIYIGDIAQPRGGPAPSGHASHQTGLDADVWLRPPTSLTLSRAAREDLPFVSVRTADQREVNANWTPAHQALLRAAASDPRVDRIFVAAAIKIAMCRTATPADTPWLQKIRPEVGHDSHFHVRLKCPAGDTLCETQTPTVAELSKGGNGCDATLQWWVTDFLEPPAADGPAAPARKHPRQYTLADLPAQCSDVLRAR